MAKDNIYLTIPDNQAKEICDILRKKNDTTRLFRSGDIAELITGMLGNFCTLSIEKVVEE